MLPRDPYDALTLENDIVGLRLWGPANQPTLSLGRSDLWDRRWFAERQPLVTLAQLKELAFSNRLAEVAPHVNQTVYNLYGLYEFPCPKPGGQVILGCPFAVETYALKRADGVIELSASGPKGRLDAEIWVSLSRPLAVIAGRCKGLAAGDVWVRVWRHRDTLRPGQPISESLGNHTTADFEPMPAPRAFNSKAAFGIIQDFPSETTFPDGFQAVLAATVMGARFRIQCANNVLRLGTPLWAPKEGRNDHGTIKRYSPINESPGAAATAALTDIEDRFTVLAAIATSHDGPDAASEAAQALDQAQHLGADGLIAERDREFYRAKRKNRAAARVGTDFHLSAPEIVLPRLRRPDGYYSDAPLCTVGGTKLWFQDIGMWHNDFHFNELRAEPMLTLGQTDALLPYCELVRNLLPMAEENARDVYGLPGAMYPLVHFPLRTRGVCHVNLTWEQDMGLNGLISKPLWLYYRHSGDVEYLRELAWPVLQSCARFCRAYLSEEADVYLHIVPTVSPEHWGLTANFERNRDCLAALTLTKYLFKAAAKAAQILGVDAAEAREWRVASERLAAWPTFNSEEGNIWVDVADAPPIAYNVPVPLSALFWGDEIGLESRLDVQAMARRTLVHMRKQSYHESYIEGVHPGYLPVIRARLGIWSENSELVPENFLLSYQTLRIFPCVPPTGEIVMENFAAEGGFLVSATRSAEGMIENVRILSRRGGLCRMANPWPGLGVVVEGEKAETINIALSGQGYMEFSTKPEHCYSIRAR